MLERQSGIFGTAESTQTQNYWKAAIIILGQYYIGLKGKLTQAFLLTKN